MEIKQGIDVVRQKIELKELKKIISQLKDNAG